MATRNTAPGTKGSGDFLTAANFNDAAGGLIGYIKVTSNQASITTVVDLTSQTLTLTPNVSRIIRLEYCFTVVSSVAGDNFVVNVVKDGATINSQQFGVSTVDNVGVATGSHIDVGPTNASHTYKLQLGRTGTSTGTFTVKGAATQPATFLIWDDGPSF